MQHGRDLLQTQESVQAWETIFETGAYLERFVEPFKQHNDQPWRQANLCYENQSYLKLETLMQNRTINNNSS